MYFLHRTTLCTESLLLSAICSYRLQLQSFTFKHKSRHQCECCKPAKWDCCVWLPVCQGGSKERTQCLCVSSSSPPPRWRSPSPHIPLTSGYCVEQQQVFLSVRGAGDERAGDPTETKRAVESGTGCPKNLQWEIQNIFSTINKKCFQVCSCFLVF